MGFFKMREPKRFNHKYIFVDERKEKLDKIVENAKRDLGMLPPVEESREEKIREAISGSTTHLKRRKEEGTRFSTQALIVGIVICLFILHFLITGKFTF